LENQTKQRLRHQLTPSIFHRLPAHGEIHAFAKCCSDLNNFSNSLLWLENPRKRWIMPAICPKCGNPGCCFHDGDVGAGNAYYDQYRFECRNLECGFTDCQTIYGGDTSWDNWFTNCPYCESSGNMRWLQPPKHRGFLFFYTTVKYGSRCM